MDDFFRFLDSDEYKNYIEKNNGINLKQDCFTTEFMERFMNSDDKTRLFNIDYSVLLKQEFLEDGTMIDYYYKPYVILEKNLNKDNRGKQSLTMTELKKMTHGCQHKSNIISILDDYTYVRESEIERGNMPKMPFFVELIDAYMFRTEDVIIKNTDVTNKTFLYKFLSEKIKIVDSVFFQIKNQEHDTQIYIRAQDKEKHSSTFGKCYDFNIVKIGAQYFYRSNPQQRRAEEARNLYNA